MFSAILKLFRTLGYLVTGQINKLTSLWSSRNDVVRARYDSLIEKSTTSVQEYREAVAAIIRNEQLTMSKLREFTQDYNKFEKLKQGALVKAKTRRDALIAQGQSEDQIRNDLEVKSWQAKYTDYGNIAEEKKKRVVECEETLTGYKKQLTGYKLNLEKMQREVANLKVEKEETVADLIAAQKEKELNDVLSGISVDSNAKELQDLREMRENAKNEAKISAELSGTAAEAQEEELLRSAESAYQNDEFDAALFGTPKQEIGISVKPIPLPET